MELDSLYSINSRAITQSVRDTDFVDSTTGAIALMAREILLETGSIYRDAVGPVTSLLRCNSHEE